MDFFEGEYYSSIYSGDIYKGRNSSKIIVNDFEYSNFYLDIYNSSFGEDHYSVSKVLENFEFRNLSYTCLYYENQTIFQIFFNSFSSTIVYFSVITGIIRVMISIVYKSNKIKTTESHN